MFIIRLQHVNSYHVNYM